MQASVSNFCQNFTLSVLCADHINVLAAQCVRLNRRGRIIIDLRATANCRSRKLGFWCVFSASYYRRPFNLFLDLLRNDSCRGVSLFEM